MIPLLWLLVLGLACGRAAEPERVCIPGETRACTGEGACTGAASCQADGQTFGACDCGDTPAADAGSDAARQGAQFNELGARCESDRDCGPALACWPASAQSFGERQGGAAGGYCTAPCEDLRDCVQFDPAAGCSGGSCVLGCYSGEPVPGEGKCRDRADLTCWSSAALGLTPFDARVRQSGICLPACGSDEDCEGRACDLASGLCVDTPTLGAATGEPCDSADDCAGQVCQSSAAGPFFCSAFCSFGTFGCGYGRNAEPREAMCLGTAVFDASGSEGEGDVGICFELCDTPADCAQPGWQCVASPEVRGRVGFCGAARGSLGDAGVGGVP